MYKSRDVTMVTTFGDDSHLEDIWLKAQIHLSGTAPARQSGTAVNDRGLL